MNSLQRAHHTGGSPAHTALLWAFTLLVVFFTLLVSHQAALADHPVIITGDIDYPPSSWSDGSTLQGVAIDVLKLAFEELGVETRVISKGPWKRAQSALKYGEADVITSVYRTAEREQYAVYVDEPYLMEKNVIWVMKDKPFPFSGWEDLKGKTGGLLLGNSYGYDWDQLFKKKLKVETVPNMLPNLKKMESGRIDYIPFALYPGTILVRRHNYQDRVVSLPTPMNSVGLYVAFSKKSSFLHLVQDINEAIIRYKADGTLDRLIAENIELYLNTHTRH